MPKSRPSFDFKREASASFSWRMIEQLEGAR